jgi:hypothetical protein
VVLLKGRITAPSSSSPDYCPRSNRSSLRSCQQGTDSRHWYWMCHSLGSSRSLSQGYVSVRSVSFQFKKGFRHPWVRIGQRTNLQCIFPRKALLAMAARERLHCQMDPLMSLQIVVAVEGLWALITLEGSIILLLLLTWMMRVHRGSHLMRWILHIHATNKCHLVSRAMYIGHNRTGHCGEVVSAIWSLVVALWGCH